MVQVVGVGPDLVTIKSRVHHRFATPAYWYRGIESNYRQPSYKGGPITTWVPLHISGYCSTINYLLGPLTLASIWCLREVSSLRPLVLQTSARTMRAAQAYKLVGRERLELPVFLVLRVYSPLPSPLGIPPHIMWLTTPQQ